MASEGSDTRRKTPTQRALSRRGFLQAAAALGGTVALGGLANTAVAHANEDFPGRPDRWGMLTDITKCIGCRMCETACAKANNMPAPTSDPAVFDKKRRTSATALTVVNRFTNPTTGAPMFRKEQCMHCDEPACASACLVGALKKTPEGPVLYNEDVCMGCRYCMVACPWDRLAYSFNEAFTPAVKKCVMCHDKVLKEGGAPACATICPTKATIFGERHELLTVARQRILQEPNKYVDQIFGEREVGGTGWLYLSSVPFDQAGFPTNLGRTPYAEYTKNFLLTVPLVLMMWPAALTGVNALIKRRDRSMAQEGKGESKKAGQG